MSMGELVILRHGESEWNASGRWTGITDVHLTKKGEHEGELLGEQIKDIHFDHAYVSEQIRTLETLQAALKTQGQTDLAYDRRRAIDERDYGEFTGLNKWEMKQQLGEDVFNSVRRGWDYPVPAGETLKDVYNRSVPFYLDEVLPLLKEGKNIMLVAHGNSIRSLMKYIENISDAQIGETEMIFGTILIYQVDQHGRMVHKEERHIKTKLPPA
jgi:2,3-bisphosphoglycerate-dependent phosphoglycerate mutase